MKKLLIAALILTSLNTSAQQRKTHKQTSNKSGLALVSVGALSMSIGFLIPDGSEWTYSDRRTGQITTKPFYQVPERVVCIGLGLTISIGGLIYNKNSR